ncbi:Crp/Fnr family transcriptional regulator [Desulfosarcina ovata]|nr:Crp/Fnr family transcriptional regulator [Desulfosarcina ovata]
MEKIISIVDYLTKSDVFKGLAEDQYDRIINLGVNKQLPPHHFLFHQSDPASQCYMVTQGQLKLTKLNENGKTVTIRYVGSGELTAAVAVIKNGVYPVTAESVQETKVVGWSQPTMMELMRRFPEIAINLLGVILSRIEDIQQRYLEICTEQVDQRIARSLLRLMRWKGNKNEKGVLIDIPLSRQSLADYSGTTLYTVSRTLSAWEKKGWVETGRERIIVTDPHALVAFAE